MPSKKKKYNARFPPARIKKIMQSDEEVGKVAQAVPVIISRALELFVESLLKKAEGVTHSRNAKTLTPSHLKQCVLAEQRFDFLKDLVATIPDVQGEEESLAETPRSASNSNPFVFPSSSTSAQIPAHQMAPSSSSAVQHQPSHQLPAGSGQQMYDLSNNRRPSYEEGRPAASNPLQVQQHAPYTPMGTNYAPPSQIPPYSNVPTSPGIGFYQDSLETSAYGHEQQQQQHPLSLPGSGTPYAAPSNMSSYPSPAGVHFQYKTHPSASIAAPSQNFHQHEPPGNSSQS